MRTSEVEKLLKENGRTWEEFTEFMFCQTVGIYEDGETNWYDGDVERFINRNTTYFD